MSVLENETHEHGEISTRLFTCAGGRGGSKRPVQRRKDPPYLSLTQVTYLSPSHGSGQGTHSSRFTNLKQTVAERRGKEEGVAGRHCGINLSKLASPRFPLMKKTLCYFPHPASPAFCNLLIGLGRLSESSIEIYIIPFNGRIVARL